MKLTIETENPAEIAKLWAALAAVSGADTATFSQVKANAEAIKGDKYATAAAAAVAQVDKAKVDKPVASVAVQPAPAANPGPIAPPVATNEIPDEAALTAAANAAIAKLGPGAQGKIKEYIGANYQKDDGSPAGLRTVKVEQRAGLLADLNAFASGAKVI